MVRDTIETGGTDPGSARKAPQINFLDVAKIRAEPLVTVPVPRMPSTMNDAELVVPKIAVARGARLIAVSGAVLIEPRPDGPNNWTPTVTLWLPELVQEKYALKLSLLMTPGTE